MQHIIPYMIQFGYVNVLILMHLTVWRELEKENKDFFEAHFQALSLQAFHG